MGDIGPGFYVPKVRGVAMHIRTYNTKKKIAEISSIATINSSASGKSQILLDKNREKEYDLELYSKLAT